MPGDPPIKQAGDQPTKPDGLGRVLFGSLLIFIVLGLWLYGQRDHVGEYHPWLHWIMVGAVLTLITECLLHGNSAAAATTADTPADSATNAAPAEPTSGPVIVVRH